MAEKETPGIKSIVVQLKSGERVALDWDAAQELYWVLHPLMSGRTETVYAPYVYTGPPNYPTWSYENSNGTITIASWVT